jgi:hypothetical protein
VSDSAAATATQRTIAATNNVNVCSLELLKTLGYSQMHALRPIALKVDNNLLVGSASVEVLRELGGDDHLVTDTFLGHPLADPFLRLFVLVVARGVDKVAALAVEVVKDALGLCLVTASHLGAELASHRALVGHSGSGLAY